VTKGPDTAVEAWIWSVRGNLYIDAFSSLLDACSGPVSSLIRTCYRPVNFESFGWKMAISYRKYVTISSAGSRMLRLD
jgi:hypothetical protein